MKLQDDQIKKTVGEYTDKNPLQKLKELNAALKKLGYKNEQEDSNTVYRKIVGRR